VGGGSTPFYRSQQSTKKNGEYAIVILRPCFIQGRLTGPAAEVI
jgi:hypothetical protein